MGLLGFFLNEMGCSDFEIFLFGLVVLYFWIDLSPTLSLRLPHFSLSFLWFSLCSSVASVLTRVSKIGVVVRWVVRLRLAVIGKKCIDHFGILIN